MHIAYNGQFVELTKQIELVKELGTPVARDAVTAFEEAQFNLANVMARALGLKHTNVERNSNNVMGNRFASAQPLGSSPTPRTITGTLYIAPGDRTSRIYAIPYVMKPGQSPADIFPEHRSDWKQVGTMRADGKLLALDVIAVPYLNDLRGQLAGTFMGIEWQVPGEPV